MATLKLENKIVEVCRRELNDLIGPAIYTSPMCWYDKDDVIDALISASLQRESVEFVAHAPTGDTVFRRMERQITFDQIRGMVRSSRPRIRGKVKLAVDGHDWMFYGKKTINGVVGTRPKAGSHYAFKYLVFKVIAGGEEYIVDVLEMFDGSVVQSAIDVIEELNRIYDVDVVVMDGEFHSVVLVQYLNHNHINYVCRRLTRDALDVLPLEYGKAYWYPEIFPTETGKLDYYVYKFRGRRNKKGDRRDFYVASNMKLYGGAIRKLIKSRWKIETGFRDVNRVRIRTRTRNFLIRLLFYAIACFIYNIWIRLRQSLHIRLNNLKSALLQVIRKCASTRGLALDVIGVG